MRNIKAQEQNIKKKIPEKESFFVGEHMIKEHFYFLTDDYCQRYEKYGVMKNKEVIDTNTNQAVEISSKALKRAIHNKAKKIIGLTKKGMRVTQTDANAIYRELKEK